MKYLKNIIISLGVGIIASLLTRDNILIFETIKKPLLTPPAIIFPIVWTILYILMGISITLIQKNNNKNVENASTIYYLQLFFNFIWSLIFFNLKMFLLAFIVILILWVLILLMISSFSKINKKAGYLQIPYFIWVTFATYLTFAIYLLN